MGKRSPAFEFLLGMVLIWLPIGLAFLGHKWLTAGTGLNPAMKDMCAMRKGGGEPRYIKAANQYALHKIGGLVPLEWVRQNADILGRYSRRVRFTPAAFQRSLVERPYLADSFNESSSPHMPTPSNMAFGVAAEVGDLETGQDLLDAMDAENTTINIRLRWDKEISNPDVREMFEKVKVATGRKPEDMDIYITTPGAGSYGWHVDVMDNMIYLLQGEKMFLVARKKAGEEPVVRAKMQPGDAVWVPHLHYHHATGSYIGQDSPSLILSIGFNPKPESPDFRYRLGAQGGGGAMEFLQSFAHAEEQKMMKQRGDYFYLTS